MIEVGSSALDYEIPPTEVVESIELVGNESDHSIFLMVRNYSLLVVADEEELELSPREALVRAVRKGFPFVAPSFRFTSYDKNHGMILQQHNLLPWDEERTSLNYPEDYFQICLNEIDEEIVDILGDGLSQVGVAVGSYENSDLMTFEFDSNGRVKLA